MNMKQFFLVLLIAVLFFTTFIQAVATDNEGNYNLINLFSYLKSKYFSKLFNLLPYFHI